jgi:transposase
MPKTRPPYSPEFRRRIVELARSGRSLSSLAREFDPSIESIRLWFAERTSTKAVARTA